jgi:uncharacterized membrane protein YjjB (DUF3815 family)
MSDIFVSYSREDSAFVRKLVDSLKAKERDVWVDFDDIPFASEWWKEVVEGIETSSSAIFVISADSINSQYCSLEISEIIKNNKKIVPIVIRRPGEDQIARLPQTIRDLNWIFFEKEEGFDESVGNLIQALDTDLDLAKEHTRLLMRAYEWERRAHSQSLLARGDELAGFLPMLKTPNLTALQSDFLRASLEQAEARQQIWRFVFGFLGGLLGMAFYVTFAFRITSVTPEYITLIIAAGEVFGLFTGIISVFAADIPLQLKKYLPRPSFLPLQVAVCLIVGMLAWVVFQWVFLRIPFGLTWASFFGGLGLSLGFIIYALFKPPAPLAFVITALSMYLPILMLNSTSITYSNLGWENPLIYFDSYEQAIWIGVPMMLLFALGATGQILYQWFTGADELTQYFNRKSGIFASED